MKFEQLLSETPRLDIAVADNRQVSVRTLGKGPAMLLLHGGHGCWMHWAANLFELSQRYTLWIPDMPGYGDSHDSPENSLEALTKVLLEAVNQLIPPKEVLTVVGFSFGGLVAAQLSVLRAHVDHLVLLGPAGHSGDRRPRGELVNWRFAHKSADANALEVAMRQNLLLQMLHAETSVTELALAIHTHACIHTRFRSKPISRSKALMGLLAQLHCPITFVWGEHDVTAVPLLVREQVLANRANRNVQIIEGAGHWVQYEAAAKVNALLRAL